MESSYNIIKQRLLSIIATERFEGNKLYSEEELVERLDASRGTVREALRSLEQDGVLTKRHGIGTFVHPSALGLRMRFDKIKDFMKLIEDGGYAPSMQRDGAPGMCSLPSITGGVGAFLDKGQEYYCFNRIYLADGGPVAHCALYFPGGRFEIYPSGEVEHDNVFDFIRRYFRQDINHALISLDAANADAGMAQKLRTEERAALLVWDELLLNYRDDILGFSRIHFRPGSLSLSMLRM